MLVRTQTSDAGRQASYAVITDFDLDRTFQDVVQEIADAHVWTFEKALAKLNFGTRNTRQGECARDSETSIKAIRTKLDAEPGRLLNKLTPESTEAAIKLSGQIVGQSDAVYQTVYKQVFPNGTLGANGDVLVGQEMLAAQPDEQEEDTQE